MPAGTKFLSPPKRPYCGWGLLFNGYRVSFPRVKPSEREVNHSPTSSAEVKNVWSYTSTPAIRFHNVNKEKFSLLHRAFDSNSLFISPTYALVNRSILMLTH